MVAAFKPWEEEEIKLVKKQAKKVKAFPKGKNGYESSQKCKHNVLAGEKAVIALVKRGIGFETALRVVEKMRVDEEVFYRDILVTERNYMKTKKFWE